MWMNWLQKKIFVSGMKTVSNLEHMNGNLNSQLLSQKIGTNYMWCLSQNWKQLEPVGEHRPNKSIPVSPQERCRSRTMLDGRWGLNRSSVLTREEKDKWKREGFVLCRILAHRRKVVMDWIGRLRMNEHEYKGQW